MVLPSHLGEKPNALLGILCTSSLLKSRPQLYRSYIEVANCLGYQSCDRDLRRSLKNVLIIKNRHLDYESLLARFATIDVIGFIGVDVLLASSQK